jgi:mono/diheme cytochrome c family protein
VRPLPVILGALALAGALAAGCGREEKADLVNGKTLFVQKCGSCHALGRANTSGVQGPDLDEAFQAARRDGLGEETVEGVVRDQIANVRRNSVMPANLVTGDDARDVSTYVALVAGQPGEDRGELAQAGRPKVSRKPVRAKDGTLMIDADPTGALAFTAARALAQPGRLSFVMENEAQVQHNIALRGPGGDLLEQGPVVGQGGTSRFSASVDPGRYTFVCTVPGHEEGGMKGTLTVE